MPPGPVLRLGELLAGAEVDCGLLFVVLFVAGLAVVRAGFALSLGRADSAGGAAETAGAMEGAAAPALSLAAGGDAGRFACAEGGLEAAGSALAAPGAPSLPPSAKAMAPITATAATPP